MKILDCEQGTDEWFKARCGIVTCTGIAKVLAKGKNGAPSDTRKRYLYEKVAEEITGKMGEQYTNAHMERGILHEPIAREMYEITTMQLVKEVGFIRADIGNNVPLGYSPDGLVGDDGLIEIKSKLPYLQVEILHKGEVPSEHKAQLQGGLLATGRAWIDFVSYCPDMPLFIKRVYPDLEYFEKIKEGLTEFYEEAYQLISNIEGQAA